MRRALRAAAAAFVAAAIGACGEEGDRDPGAGGRVPSADGPEHIHGLGVNPADDALVIATHSGLFRAAPGEQRARRIGDSHQDTMGFTIAGPDRFLGSGHPDVQGLRDGLPGLLGLIRSDDGGRNWRSVSLLGRADFHVLRLAGRRIYGVNATDGRLFSSADGGRTWRRLRPPGPLLDLVADPGDPDAVLASGERGLFVSRDGGKRWRPAGSEHDGLLAWPRREALFLVDGLGRVHRSGDRGGTWRAVGSIGGQPAAFAAHGAELYVALHTNEVKVSRDGGRTWSPRVAA